MTIDDQIEEAMEDLAWLRTAYTFVRASRPSARMQAKAEKRLERLLAVRDGAMVEVYATVAVRHDRGWMTFEWVSDDPDHATPCILEASRAGDTLTILRGYAHVPSTQVHEVEANYEVPS